MQSGNSRVKEAPANRKKETSAGLIRESRYLIEFSHELAERAKVISEHSRTLTRGRSGKAKEVTTGDTPRR